MDRLIALVLLRWKLELRGVRCAPRARGRPPAGAALPAAAVRARHRLAYVRRAQRWPRRTPACSCRVLSAVATVVGLFWVLSPLLTGRGPRRDPRRLAAAALPGPRCLARGLVAAGEPARSRVAGRDPDAARRGRGGAVAAAAGGPAGRARRRRSRPSASSSGRPGRGPGAARRSPETGALHDTALFVGLGLGFALSLLPFLLFSGAAARGRPAPALVALDVFVFSPFAWGVRAAVHAGRGDTARSSPGPPWPARDRRRHGAWPRSSSRRIHRGEVDLGGASAAAGRGRRAWSARDRGRAAGEGPARGLAGSRAEGDGVHGPGQPAFLLSSCSSRGARRSGSGRS